jgi:hypothetical protein
MHPIEILFKERNRKERRESMLLDIYISVSRLAQSNAVDIWTSFMIAKFCIVMVSRIVLRKCY